LDFGRFHKACQHIGMGFDVQALLALVFVEAGKDGDHVRR
jgi:hypothetical protein